MFSFIWQTVMWDNVVEQGVCVTLLTLEKGGKQKDLGKRVVCSVKRCNFVFENLVCLFSFNWKRRGGQRCLTYSLRN